MQGNRKPGHSIKSVPESIEILSIIESFGSFIHCQKPDNRKETSQAQGVTSQARSSHTAAIFLDYEHSDEALAKQW